MSPDSLASRQSSTIRSGADGRLVLIGSGMFGAWRGTVAVLASADAIFCEEAVDPTGLALVAPGVFIERVPVDDDRAPARFLLLDRARRLASDGWRVVWLVPGDSETASADIRAAGAVTMCDVADCRKSLYRRHAVATVQNGLAG